jgi:hypothetical protein
MQYRYPLREADLWGLLRPSVSALAISHQPILGHTLLSTRVVAEVWYVLEHFPWREDGVTAPLLHGSKV